MQTFEKAKRQGPPASPSAPGGGALAGQLLLLGQGTIQQGFRLVGQSAVCSLFVPSREPLNTTSKVDRPSFNTVSLVFFEMEGTTYTLSAI